MPGQRLRPLPGRDEGASDPFGLAGDQFGLAELTYDTSVDNRA